MQSRCQSTSSTRPGSLILLGPLIVAAFLAQSSVAAGARIIQVPGQVTTIQGALYIAGAGDTIEVATGVYREKLVFPSSGSPGLPIVLTAAAGAQPILDGIGSGAGSDMVLIDGKSHLVLAGFEIRNHLGVSDGSGVRILGSGTDLEIRDNILHEIRGSDAMGITVYGTGEQAISNLRILDNQIYDCDPAQSEALTLNGNVDGFVIEGNLVRDVNNIGIDMIGGEVDIQPDASLVARHGVVRRNTILRANSSYGGGYAGGIYVDGGRDIVIENNWIESSDLGIEIGAENDGTVTSGIVVRNNVLLRNERAGLVFGGFEGAAGRADGNQFRGNTLVENNTVGGNGSGRYFQGGGIAEIWVQWASSNTLVGNLVVGGPENVLIGSYDAGSSSGNLFDYNLFWSPAPAAAELSLNGAEYAGLAAWQAATGNDAHSLASDPLLVDAAAGELHLGEGSPATDAGEPTYCPASSERDLDLGPRLFGRAVDIGADEAGATALLFADGFESGETTSWGLQPRTLTTRPLPLPLP